MKVKIQCPSSLSELNVGQYIDFRKLKEPESVDVINIFLNLPMDLVMKVEKAQIDSIAEDIIKMFDQDLPMINVFKLNGKEFGFVPALNEISYGEYMDATNYMSTPDNQDFNKLMAVLYRPITNRRKDKYLIEDYEGSDKYANELLKMPLSIALGTQVFFYNLLNDLLRTIPHYLLKHLDEETLAEIVSLKNGDNTFKYTQSVKETLEGLTRLPDYRYTSA